MSELIFALDVGKASLGICVRAGNTLHLMESLLIPAEFGDTSDLRPRRRAFRTREAHKKREDWLIRQWEEAGLAVPNRQSPNFVREFPRRGEDLICNSALLRIALIQERPLAEWQIFKALWAAIQHRGYDPACNWEKPSDDLTPDEDTKQNLDALDKYKESLFIELGHQEIYHFPCYLEACLMGLWDSEKPHILKTRIRGNANRARGRVAPREYVVKELEALLRSAQKQLPSLARLDIAEWLYGPARKPYASLSEAFSHYRGTEWDAQGLLSQKVPRFDNRIIDKCRMLPKRNVCKADNPLNMDFVLLQKLKNVRFRLAGSPEEGLEGRLNPVQLQTAAAKCKQEIQSKLASDLQTPKLTVAALIKIIREIMGDKVVDHNLKKEDDIRLNPSGRASYCRPALEIMNRILLEGIDPPNFDLSPYVQSGKPNGITQKELEAFCARLGKTWEGFHPGDRRMENLATARNQDMSQRERDVLSLIGNVNNPVVRHRLTIIDNTLKSLVARFGEPDKIMLEFVRGDQGLEGRKTANEWESAIKMGTRRNDDIRKRLIEAGLKPSHWNIERVKLGDEQAWQCPYTDEKLSISCLQDYDVDHIVPVSNLIATDAFYNKVLCIHTANRDKRDRMPYEWLSGHPDWEEYLARVTRRASIKEGYSLRKKALLTSSKARDLIQSYNGLAETAYIARLTQAMIAIRFAWPVGNLEEKRRIFINDGRITARIRKTYQLNELLLSPAQKEELEAAQNIGERRKIWEKNRENKKHHALDAYCISYAQQFRSESKGDGRFRWFVPRAEGSPGLEESKGLMEQQLKAMFPKTIRRNTKKLYPNDTIYGYRTQKEKSGAIRHYLTVRKSLVQLLEKDRKKIKTLFDPALRTDLTTHSERIADNAEWKKFLEKYQHPILGSTVKKVQVMEANADAAPIMDESGRACFGPYKDFGNRKTETRNGRNKGITTGQFRCSTANKGQLLVSRDGKKWKVQPVLSHEKMSFVLKRLKQDSHILYQAGQLFYPGCQIHVPSKFKAGKVDLEAGDYNMLSMWSAGPVELSDSNGIKYLTHVNYLTAADFKLVK